MVGDDSKKYYNRRGAGHLVLLAVILFMRGGGVAEINIARACYSIFSIVSLQGWEVFTTLDFLWGGGNVKQMKMDLFD